MYKRHYLDPLGKRLPALEQNIIRLRSIQMVLVLFYAERLRQTVLSLIQSSDSLRSSFDSNHEERVPKGSKNALKKCLTALLDDGAINDNEKNEIQKLLDYRNVAAHDLHELTADISAEYFVRNNYRFSPETFSSYDYDAVNRLRYYLDLFDNRKVFRQYITEISLDSLMFASTEKTLLFDIKKLNKKIERQMAKRANHVEQINDELSLNNSTNIEEHPDHPLNLYDNKRLTKRGVEICYRLFDQRKSAIAVAHLMGISLESARKRQRMWRANGGHTRPRTELDSLPRRKFYRRYDD